MHAGIHFRIDDMFIWSREWNWLLFQKCWHKFYQGTISDTKIDIFHETSWNVQLLGIKWHSFLGLSFLSFGKELKLVSWLHFSNYYLELGFILKIKKMYSQRTFNLYCFLTEVIWYLSHFNYNKTKWNDYEVQLTFQLTLPIWVHF